MQTALADTPGNKLTSKGQELLQSNDFAGVVRLLLPHLDMLLSAADDRSMDCCLILLIQLVVRASDSDEPTATRLADDLMAALATSTKEKPVARVSAMLELFNAWPRSPYQYNLLMKILAFANSEKLSQLAVPLYGRADLWDRAWQLTQTQSMDMFEGIAKVLDMHPSPLLKKEAFGLQTRVLLSCPADDKKRIDALKPTARSAALAFIGNPTQFSCDVFNTAPVQALKTDSESSKVYELLDLLLHGKLSEFDSSKYTATLEQASTTETDVMSKVCTVVKTTGTDGFLSDVVRCAFNDMLQVGLRQCHPICYVWYPTSAAGVQMRLMALLAVCSSKEGMDVTFAEVEQALALEEGQAEGWLVQAFGKQLLDGRINQVCSTQQASYFNATAHGI